MSKCFTSKSISHQLRIFSPVNSKKKLMGEMAKKLNQDLAKARGTKYFQTITYFTPPKAV